MSISLSSFAPENLVSRDGFGSPVPRQALISIFRLNQMITYGIPPDSRGGFHSCINRHTPSGQSRVYRVTQLRTDGVQCRESAGTGSVVLKIVPSECCLGQVTMEQLIYASLSHTHYWHEVGMLKVPAKYLSSRPQAGLATVSSSFSGWQRVRCVLGNVYAIPVAYSFLYVCMYGQHFQQSMDQPGVVASSPAININININIIILILILILV